MKNILKIYNNSWNIIIKNIVKIKLVNKIKWLIKIIIKYKLLNEIILITIHIIIICMIYKFKIKTIIKLIKQLLVIKKYES